MVVNERGCECLIRRKCFVLVSGGRRSVNYINCDDETVICHNGRQAGEGSRTMKEGWTTLKPLIQPTRERSLFYAGLMMISNELDT